jgi:hypothetical protein
MSKADDSRDEDRDDNDDDLDEQDDAESEEEVKPRSTGAKVSSPAPERAARSTAPAAGGGTSRTALVAILALAAGGAAGWFGHQAKAKAALRAETNVPATAGSAGSAPAGPCGAWQQKICASSGAESAACQQAQAATGLLMPPTCEAALEALPGTLAKIKAARAPCENLTTKLCKDLPPGSATCQMVKQRTTSFPGDRCAEMVKNYDSVLAEVKMIDQQSGGAMGGANPHAPPGAPPGAPGMPPQGMPPQGMPPQGMPPQGAPPGHP